MTFIAKSIEIGLAEVSKLNEFFFSEGFSDEIRNWFEFDRDWTRRGE